MTIFKGGGEKERLFILVSSTRISDRKIMELTFEEVKHLLRLCWILISTSGGLYEWWKVDVNIGKSAWDICSATWNLSTNSTLAPRPMKILEKLGYIARSQVLQGAYWLLACRPAFKYRNPNGSPYVCSCGTSKISRCVLHWLVYCLFLWKERFKWPEQQVKLSTWYLIK
jgi:hypothetical protein